MGNRERPQLICVTPMKNEAWILERFLQCASLWADHIILADQCSDDGSREIAARYPKVTLVDNNATGYDEGERQRLVFEAARRIPGKRILLAIDADEAITANWMESAEWAALRDAPEGTVIRFRWVNILPDFETGWLPPMDIPMGFVDDGKSGHSAGQFHVPRLPIPPGAPELVMREIKVLHYQYADWQRMKSKQRGYQCFEHRDNPDKRPIQLYRQYHHMDAIPSEQILPLSPEWFAGYEQHRIDMKRTSPEPFYRWDQEIVQMLLQYGAQKFRKLDIWDVDWADIACKAGVDAPSEALRDPRSAFEKRVQRWLRDTQARCLDPKIRYVQRLLRVFGW